MRRHSSTQLHKDFSRNDAKKCVFYDLFKVQFVDNREIDNVNVKDFFLHVFKVLMAPESELFMFNETETACWFPPKVRPLLPLLTPPVFSF